MSTFYNKSCASIQSCDENPREYLSTSHETQESSTKVPRPIILVDEVSIGGTVEYHIIAPPSMRLVSDGFLYEPIDPKKESTDSWTTSAGLIWIVPVTEEDTIVTFRLGKHTVTYPLHSFLFAATSAPSAPSISNGISNGLSSGLSNGISNGRT